MASTNVLEKVKNLPKQPGVYIYKDETGEIIYVGKAKSLKNRVSSYFSGNLDKRSKTYALVQRINDIDTILVESEFEALLLEAELIKKYLPVYNILLKDDKSYLYIVIRNEKVEINGKPVSVPVLMSARKTTLLPKDTYFGPYPDGTTAKYVIKTLRKIFPFRDCTTGKFNRYHKLGSPCLYGHIKACPAPCDNNSEQDLHEYKNNFEKINRILAGDASAILNELKRKMDQASQSEDYETAIKYRNILEKFNYVRQTFRGVEEYVENPYLLDDLALKALDELVAVLPNITHPPLRIECYDISNISGKEAVGSMVVATDGRIDKSQYRKFKIKFKDSPDDFDMMHEVLYRRLKREKAITADKEKWRLPDLIILDGGKGQISAVLAAMDFLDFHLPVIGIAKKFETLVYKKDGEFFEVSLPKDNLGLRLVITLRDEAHRFAQKYHHLLRSKLIRSV